MSIGRYSIGNRSIANAGRTGAFVIPPFVSPWVDVRFKPLRITQNHSRAMFDTPASIATNITSVSRIEIQSP